MSSLLVFIRVYRLEIQSVILVFSTQFFDLLSGSTLPPTHFPVSKYSIYRQCVAERGCGVLSCVGDHILQGVLHSVSHQIQNLQNCFITPNKNLGGEGAPDR